MTRRYQRAMGLLLAGIVCANLVSRNAPACVSFPNFYSGNAFMGNNAAQILYLPTLDFEAEFFQIAKRFAGHDAPKFDGGFGAEARQARTLAADLADLNLALQTSRLDVPAREALVARYSLARTSVITLAGNIRDVKYGYRAEPFHRERDIKHLSNRILEAWDPHASWLHEIPAEFRLYATGAALFRAGNSDAAVKMWTELLALPVSERKYRSVWAAAMLGKSAMEPDPEAAIAWFHAVRQLVDEGFTDSLGLAVDSLDQQADVELALGRTYDAIRHYYDCGVARGNLGSVYRELKAALVDLRQDEQQLALAMTDPEIAELLLVYLLSRHEPGDVVLKQLPKLLENKSRLSARFWDHIVHILYNGGHFDEAWEVIQALTTPTPFAKWVESKLLAREGRLTDALSVIEAIHQPIRELSTWVCHSDIYFVSLGGVLFQEGAVLQAALGQFDKAADWLMTGELNTLAAKDAQNHEHAYYAQNDYHDLDYLLEDVLTVDEAMLVARRNQYHDAIVVGRRLFRLNRLDEGIEFFPWEDRATAVEYRDLVKVGHSNFGSKRMRGIALVKAAHLAASEGDILFQSNVSLLRRVPWQWDWADSFGMPSAEFRPRMLPYLESFRYLDLRVPETIPNFSRGPWGWWDEPPYSGQPLPSGIEALVAGTDAEIKRVIRHRSEAFRMFGSPDYRVHASNLLWEAARLLPDNDPWLAHALWWGGYFRSQEAPAISDRFYKALVKRCRHLEVGREAERRRWFPPREFLPVIEGFN